MHVIWAVGQDSKEYKHFPKSGLERDEASVKDFYKEDELKYHGHGDQRGFLEHNFFGILSFYDFILASIREKQYNM